MEASDCPVFSNPHVTGSRPIRPSESPTEPGSLTYSTTMESLASRSWYSSADRQLRKARAIGGSKAVLPFVVAVVALFVVWGLVCLTSVFFALPVNPPNGLNASDKANKSIETRNNRMTCYSLWRWDSLTNSCYIPCSEWDWRTESENEVRLAMLYINIVVSSVCAIVTIVTWIKLRHLWSFIQLGPFYITECLAINGLAKTIPIAFAKEVFCSHENFTQSLDNPTVFCSVSGALRHYLLIASVIWWLCAVGNVWWIIVFPTKGNLLFENKGRIQILQAIAAWGVPFVLVATVFAVDGRYSQTVLFPYTCFPRTIKLQYYTYSLPSQFLVGASCTLLIWTCYSLKQKIRRRNRISSRRFSVPSNKHDNSLMKIEKQLLFVLISFAIIKIFGLIGYALSQRNFDVISTAFNQYVDCTHSNPEEDCILLFREYANTQTELAADFVWQTTSVVIPTIFFFGYKHVRELWFSLITCDLYSRKTAVSQENVKNAQETHRNNEPAAQAISGQL